MSCHDTGMPPTFRKVGTHSHFFLFFIHSVDPTSLRPVAHPHRRALTIFLFLNQVPFLNLTASTPWRSLYYMVSMCQCLRLICGYISLESLHL